MSVLSGLFFKEMYELLVGECQTVRINRVSVERGSTVPNNRGEDQREFITTGDTKWRYVTVTLAAT